MFRLFFSNSIIKIYENLLLFPPYGLSLLRGVPTAAVLSRGFLNTSVPSAADSIIMHN